MKIGRMLRYLFFLSAVTLTFLVSGSVFAAPDFSAEELSYISQKKTVSIGVVEGNEPYSYYKNGMISGYSIDILKQVEAQSGLHFKLVAGNWSDIYNSFIQGNIDALNEVSYTKGRSSFMLFTEPFHVRKTVFFTRKDMELSKTSPIESLRGKKVGILKDIYYEDAVKATGLNLVEYANFTEIMKSLAFGWTDAVIVSELSGLYIARENSLSNIKPAGSVGIPGFQDEDFRIGVHKNDKLLHSILLKSLAAIPDNQMKETQTRWAVFMGKEVSVKELSLTEKEKAFIESHPTVSMGLLPDYPPFSYIYNSGVTGYTTDLLKIISRKTGLKFSYNVDSWSNNLSLFKSKKLDAIANISYTPDRAPYTLYTEEYYKIPNVVFIRDNFSGYKNLSSLIGKKVGITRDVFFKEKLISTLTTGIVEYDSQDDMIRDLSFGKLDAVITSLVTGDSIIKKYALVNVRIAEQFLQQGVGMEDLRFGISPAHPELFSIFQKTMNSISPQEKIKLEQTWLNVKEYDASANKVSFTNDEIAYLSQKKLIRMCIDPAWMPFEHINEEGVHEGIAADFFELMKQNANINILLVPTKSWAQSMEFAKQRKCDLFSLAMKTPDRLSYMNFTTPYLVVPTVIATSVNDPYIDDIRNYKDKTFAMGKGYAFTELFKKLYPEIHLVETPTNAEGIRLLQNGDVYGVIDTMATIGYQIRQQKITDIKISGRMPFDLELAVAARNDEPLLRDIFQKMADSISEDQKKEMMNKWMSIRYEQGFDYSLFWKALAGVLFLLLIVSYWGNKMRKLNKQLQIANMKLKELSEKDSLTGLYNRRYFSATGETILAICQRSSIRFSMAILDIDHFKKINDTFGHLAGDKCLQELGNLLKSEFGRQTDTIARYGGEEFAVFTTSGEDDSLYKKMEKIRSRLEQTIINADGMDIHMTVSVGIYTSVPDTRITLDTIFKNADDELYKAKNGGRNRVCIYKD